MLELNDAVLEAVSGGHKSSSDIHIDANTFNNIDVKMYNFNAKGGGVGLTFVQAGATITL